MLSKNYSYFLIPFKIENIDKRKRQILSKEYNLTDISDRMYMMNMVRDRWRKKSIEKIEKKYYNFDLQIEKSIYEYVCHVRVRGRRVKKLNNELRFKTYREWKSYVRGKYENFESDRLIEFSRYLNQRIRSIKPNHEYKSIAVTVVLTVAFTKWMEALLNTHGDLSGMLSTCEVANLLAVVAFIGALFEYLIFYTWNYLFGDSMDENFYLDYKEIIDEIIEEKLKNIY